jgi:hypothetical protein
MGFFTIFVAPGLSEAAYRRALRSGPSLISTRRREHVEILRSAGFSPLEELDLTAEFLVTARAWYDGRERRASDLIAAEGRDLFEERRRDSATQLQAIEAGLLRRALFVSE